MMGRYKIDLYAKGLAYKELQPIAKVLGMQLLLLDPKTYRLMLDFDKRLKRFGVSQSEVNKLQREMDDGSTVAIFKSKKYYGTPEILPYFSTYDLDEDAIHFMRSTNADKHEDWGDFSNDIPEGKRMFLYWINVDVLDENGNVVLESAKNEWKVKFTDDDEDGEQIASFDSEREASNWIKCQEINDRYEPHHFEVVDGPYREQATPLHEICQKMKTLLEKLLAARSWQQLEESAAKADQKAVQYVKDFKDFFGYKDDYMPKKSYSKEMDSLAAECALRMPTDTAAREIEGDAVMLLVLSGEEDAVKAGKKLGDCMMKKSKHDEETLLKRMSDAYKALQDLWAKHERDIEESEDTAMKKQYTKEQITEAITHWKGILKKMDEEFVPSETEYVEPEGDSMLAADLAKLLQLAASAGNSTAQVACLISTDDSDLASSSNFIGGFVNSVQVSGEKCVLTLSPHRSGSRKQDLSVNSEAPFTAESLASKIAGASGSLEVAVKMKDPFGMGPNAGRVVEAPVFAGKNTAGSFAGVFLYTSAERATAVQDGRTDEAEDKDRKAELDAFAQTICGFITKAVMNGFWKPEYEGEQPTRDRIEASLPWAMLPGVTAEEKAYVMNIVYPKLRKNSIFSKMKKKMAGEEVNEGIVNFEDPDEITIHQMLKEARKLFPHNSDGGKLSPIVGIVDGHLADFTHCTFAKHDGFPDSGTFFLHDGTTDSLNALEEQLVVGHYYTKLTNEAENPDDAKADDLFIKGDKYEEELRARAELAKEEAKKMKVPEDAKKFIEKNKDKIAEVSKKLKGKAKEDFDKVVQFVKDNTDKVEESSKSTKHTVLLGLLFGCVGVISFLLSLNTLGWIALSPVVGPLLMGTVKKLSGLDESGEQKKDEEKESGK